MATTTSGSGSQTLSRGIRILEVLAESERPLSIAELAEALDLHRSIIYRMLRTLEDHGLVVRDDAGRLALGAGLAALASGVARNLRQAAQPEITEVADELGMTCLVVGALEDEAVTLLSATPRRSTAVVSYRIGHRHPLVRGGSGKAVLLGMPEESWPESVTEAQREEIRGFRERGHTVSKDEVVPTLRSVAVPLRLPGQPPAAVAAVHVSFPRPEAEIAEVLHRAVENIVRAYGA